jgi:hypothetical protein
MILALMAFPAAGDLITGTIAHGWPNERTSSNPPSLAADGDLATFTWTTESFTTQAGYLGLDFGRSVSVDRLRLFKDNWGGGGPNIKNLDILLTTDSTTIPLASRSFVHVSNLTNGFYGTELLHATSVNSDGTVVGDIQSLTDGWASLSFDSAAATGVAIRFFYPGGSFQHYKVHEFQAFSPSSPVPEIDAAGLGSALALVGGAAGIAERRRSGRTCRRA